ncbi:MAG: hypothetical protein DRH50_11155 [Deltaproteobacteria bacterium]|nr:MAG: hypothetical protein DRH50_11155 [Deltaproteobacteria bacterium]
MSNTLALLKNRHTERTGHPIGDRLKLETLPAGRQVTERKEKTALRSSNQIHSVTISVIVKDEYPPYCFFSTLTKALRQRASLQSDGLSAIIFSKI